MIKNQLVSDFFAELTDVFARLSHDLQPTGAFTPATAIHGAHAQPAAFQAVARELICELMGQWITACAKLEGSPVDNTWCFPLYQMGPFGIRQDELATAGGL